MSVILEFTQKERDKFIKKIGKKKYWLNDGTEGDCYSINGDVYKIYSAHYTFAYNTICKDDLDLESFLFPTEIYMCDNRVFGYKTDTCVNEDTTHEDRLQIGRYPNLDNVKRALEQLVRDIYVLSRNHVFADDLAWCNLLFDGEKFYVIDTLRYEHHNELDVDEIYKENINLLIYECINPFIDEYQEKYRTSNKQDKINEKRINKLYGLIPYIKELAKQIKSEYGEKEVQKIKRS